ncbi:MAG: HEPN domain-containing protein [Candidatus Acidiferrum sp.]
MAIPSSKEARLSHRCALARYDDALVLLNAEHNAGAVYLAGYSVECMLKALLLTAVSAANRAESLRSFRGNRGHHFQWLRARYFANGGPRFPPEINRCFILVNDWSTDMRYSCKPISPAEADGFLDAAGTILRWAHGRI